MSKVNVFSNEPNVSWGGFEQEVIARVEYNSRLDTWDGHNWTSGGVGMHKGITKLKKSPDPSRPYVIIVGSQWQGAIDFGYLVTAKEAMAEICKANCANDDWVWPEIKAMIAEMDNSEED